MRNRGDYYRDAARERRARLDRFDPGAEIVYLDGGGPGDANAGSTEPKIKPVTADDRSRNPLRPRSFDDMVGQERAIRVLRSVVETARRNRTPLDHTLLVGPSGTGKSTFSHVIACELGDDVDIYEVEAPVTREYLLELRGVAKDRDLLRVEEIHQQAIMERRGRNTSTEPEVLYNVLEDRTIVSEGGVLPFPAITIVGTTTDEGMLPEPFLNRFPLRPRLEPYEPEQLAGIGRANARTLGVVANAEALVFLAGAARGTPRVMNNYVKNALSLGGGSPLDMGLARKVLYDLNGVTVDGLTDDMVKTLIYLLTKSKKHQASIASIATGIGKSRDTKALVLRVEPWLIERGLIEVTHGGRRLTEEGVLRAQQLLTNPYEEVSR